MLTNRSECIMRIHELGLGSFYFSNGNTPGYTPLMSYPRAGWKIRKIEDGETVGDHCIESALLVMNFREQIRQLGVSTSHTQDIILIHDIAEPDPRVTDITPYDNISPAEKKRRETTAIREIFHGKPELLALWEEGEEGTTKEGRIAKEIEKLQAIIQASLYEKTHKISGLVDEFYTYTVIRKHQIQTDFLLSHATRIYAGKFHR